MQFNLSRHSIDEYMKDNTRLNFSYPRASEHLLIKAKQLFLMVRSGELKKIYTGRDGRFKIFDGYVTIVYKKTGIGTIDVITYYRHYSEEVHRKMKRFRERILDRLDQKWNTDPYINCNKVQVEIISGNNYSKMATQICKKIKSFYKKDSKARRNDVMRKFIKNKRR